VSYEQSQNGQPRPPAPAGPTPENLTPLLSREQLASLADAMKQLCETILADAALINNMLNVLQGGAPVEMLLAHATFRQADLTKKMQLVLDTATKINDWWKRLPPPPTTPVPATPAPPLTEQGPGEA
jgi:hypothetical protein